MSKKLHDIFISQSAKYIFALLFFFAAALLTYAQVDSVMEASSKDSSYKVHYGMASYYANKFIGRKTANGEIFSQEKLTAACNILTLGTWIKVTNLKNDRSVVVKINDRLHPKSKRMIDLTTKAAKKLNYIKGGLTRVKIEVLNEKETNSKKKKDK